jgi:hypothetical protein
MIRILNNNDIAGKTYWTIVRAGAVDDVVLQDS